MTYDEAVSPLLSTIPFLLLYHALQYYMGGSITAGCHHISWHSLVFLYAFRPVPVGIVSGQVAKPDRGILGAIPRSLEPP